MLTKIKLLDDCKQNFFSLVLMQIKPIGKYTNEQKLPSFLSFYSFDDYLYGTNVVILLD